MKAKKKTEPGFSCCIRKSPLILISQNQIKLVIVIGKRKVEYTGILVNIDNHFNILLKRGNFLLQEEKKLEFLNGFDEVVVSGNNVDLISPSIF